MPGDLASALASWHEFLIVTGGAAAVLLGLVFIGLSIRMEDRDMRNRYFLLAVGSAESFVHPLLASFVLLAPPLWPWIPGVALLLQSFLLVGGLGAVVTGGVMRAADRPAYRSLVKPYFIPLFGAFAMLVGSVGLLLGWADSLYLIALGIYILIALGVQNAWDYLYGRS
jgi:hypothetical protein